MPVQLVGDFRLMPHIELDPGAGRERLAKEKLRLDGTYGIVRLKCLIRFSRRSFACDLYKNYNRLRGTRTGSTRN